MKIIIKKKPEGYTVKTPDKVAKQLTYGEMLAVVAALTAPADGVRECEYLKPRKPHKTAIKFKLEDFTTKNETIFEQNKQSTGRMIRNWVTDEQGSGRLSRNLTGEELIQKVMALNTPSPSPIFNEYDYDLRYFLPDGWDGVDKKYRYVAIDEDGDVFAYTHNPKCFDEDGYFGYVISRKQFAFEELATVTIPFRMHWAHLIWERPKTTQP